MTPTADGDKQRLRHGCRARCGCRRACSRCGDALVTTAVDGGPFGRLLQVKRLAYCPVRTLMKPMGSDCHRLPCQSHGFDPGETALCVLVCRSARDMATAIQQLYLRATQTMNDERTGRDTPTHRVIASHHRSVNAMPACNGWSLAPQRDRAMGGQMQEQMQRYASWGVACRDGAEQHHGGWLAAAALGASKRAPLSGASAASLYLGCTSFQTPAIHLFAAFELLYSTVVVYTMQGLVSWKPITHCAKSTDAVLAAPCHLEQRELSSRTPLAGAACILAACDRTTRLRAEPRRQHFMIGFGVIINATSGTPSPSEHCIRHPCYVFGQCQAEPAGHRHSCPRQFM
jgi:hypothetical protein